MNVTLLEPKSVQTEQQNLLLNFRNKVFSETYSQATVDNWSEYDEHSNHFVVTSEADGVVGYYRTRLFSSNNYSGSQASSLFEHSTFSNSQNFALELSRAAVHEKYRDGTVISLLWTKIAQYLLSNGVQYCFGTTSASNFSPHDFYYLTYSGSLLPYHVTPLHYNYSTTWENLSESEVKKKYVTTLLRAYSKQGALFCPYPAYDVEWNCYDYFTVFKTSSLVKKFRKLV